MQPSKLEINTNTDTDTDSSSPQVRIDETLLDLARAAHHKAYAPYSGFHVGAALRTGTGKVFFGANVENSSYGMGRCAEQSAIQAMATSGEREFVDIVVYTESSPPATPCGGCRQVLFEFSPEARVTCVNQLGETITGQVKDFLPHGFRLQQ